MNEETHKPTDKLTNKPEARRTSIEGIGLYNYRRPHTSLGFKTPGEVHGANAKH